MIPSLNASPSLGRSPARLLLLVALAVFVGEAVVMSLLGPMEGWPHGVVVLIDAALLVALVFPVLYFGVFRSQLSRIKQVEESKQALVQRQGELEQNAALLRAEVAERKRVEGKLRLQGTALESMANVVVITDPEGTIQWVNPAFSNLTGYTREEAIGQNPRVLKSGLTNPATYVDMWRTIKAGQVWRGELSNRRKDGTLFTEAVTITPVRADGGEITHFIAIKEDITALKEAQANQRLSEQKTERILQGSASILWLATVTATGGTNRAWRFFVPPSSLYRRIFGCDPDRDNPALWTESMVPEWNAINANSERALRDGLPVYEQEFTVVVNGQEFHLHEHVTVEQIGPGEWRLTGVATDISDVRRTLQKLADREARLQFLFESVPVGLSWNEFGRDDTRLINAEVTRITGVTAEDARTPGVFARLTHPDDLARQDALVREVQEGKIDRFTIDKRYLRPDGSITWVRLTQRYHRDAQGDITQELSSVVDITEAKNREALLERAHAELQAKNRLLDTALSEAKSAVEAKAMFLATMSHEIRTPMNGVIGMASLLSETGPLTEEQADYISTIRTSGESLMTIINDILDFSKMESNGMVLESAPFDLQACLEDTLDGLAPRAREKHLDLAVEFAPGVPAAVEGDGLRLRQVITNLAGNAIKFTARGEVVVEVRSEPLNGNRARLLFRVRDTGIGIPPDKIDRLFKSFSQVDSSTTRQYGGTGLGLAISQRLVGLMGGTIKVASRPGEGSVFSFEIEVPVAEGVEPFDPATLPADLPGRSILVVDDNATNRRIFTSQLRLLRCHPVALSSAQEALEWLNNHTWPDLIVTDMLMPGMDGLDFACAVRRMEVARKIVPITPIVMISSGGFQPSDPRAAEAQLSQCLLKPLRQQQLFHAVIRACSLTPPRRRPTVRPLTELRQAMSAEHPCRILLAEDNAVNRKVALAILGRLGYTADTAENGALAVEACRAKTYDLVFMDMQMPVMGGLEATRAIRALPITQPRIVAMTANVLEGDREDCLAAGMNDFISKPVKPDDLRMAVAATLPAAPA